MAELLHTYRDGIAKPRARDQHNWDRLVWATLARGKQTDKDEPPEPPILRD